MTTAVANSGPIGITSPTDMVQNNQTQNHHHFAK